jgi:hypothetical protein
MAICSICSQDSSLYNRDKDGTITCMSCIRSVPKLDPKVTKWLEQKLIVSREQPIRSVVPVPSVPAISDVNCAACLTAIRGDPPTCLDCRWLRKIFIFGKHSRKHVLGNEPVRDPVDDRLL